MTDTIEYGIRAPGCSVTTEETIDDVRHPVARRIADVLRNRSARPRVFVIDDEENILQALRCGVRIDSLYTTGGTDPAPFHPAVGGAIPSHTLSPAVMRHLFGGQKQCRVFALAHSPRPPALPDLNAMGDIVVLDGVRLVGNIGAIIRTACALGAAGVVLIDSGLTTTLDRRLVRASRGLVFAVPVILASRGEFHEHARREGLPLACLTADAPEPLSAIRSVPKPLALVVGGERHGVSDEWDALAPRRYSIPMDPDVESLNVSVAAAIALYENRQRTSTR